MPIHILYICICNLYETQLYREEETRGEGKENFIYLFTPQNGHNAQGWTRQKPEAKNSIWVSYMEKYLSHLSTSFPDVLARWSNRDSNGCPYSMSMSQTVA